MTLKRHIAPVVELVDAGVSKTPAFGRARSIRAGGTICFTANVAELVDAPDLGFGGFGREGSTPSIGTIFCFCADGETGRHASLRGWWRKPCGFESRSAHHLSYHAPVFVIHKVQLCLASETQIGAWRNW